MANIQSLATFLGWCTVINFGIYLFTALILMGFRKPIKKIHSQLAAVAYDRLDELYFSYLGNYKIAIIIFNLAPYVAFKVMA